MLTLIYALNFLDRQLLSILAEPIRRDLGLTDTQLGLLSGIVFAAFYTLFGVPVGWIADRASRVRIISFACAIWSLFTVLCGLATNFWQLALARMGVGFGEAGGAPPSYSLISDYFAPTERATALAVYSMAVPFGAMIGAALGGFIAAEYGWRMAFFCLGAPGIIMALLLAVFVKEPRRGRLDKLQMSAPAQDPLPTFGEAVADFFTNPILARIAVAGGLSAFIGYGAMSWNPPFLMRVKGMTLTEIAFYYSVVVGITGMIGTFVSGRLADILMAKDRRWAAWLPAIALFISIPFWVGVLWAPTWPIALAFLVVPSVANLFYLAPALALVQNSVAPNRRTISGAIILLIINLIGLGAGPLYIGWISDWAASRYDVSSLSVGLAALIPVIVVAIGAQLFAARAIGKPPQALQINKI